MTDDDPSFATDDAVRNSSDDTALDEGEGAQSNGRELSVEDAGQAEQTEPGAENQRTELTEAKGQQSVAEEAEAQETDTEAAVEDEASAPEPVVAPRGPIEETPEEPEDIHMDWFILKVQSNRERTIADALTRKMKIEGYERFFDQAIVPTEKVTEFKAGKKKVVERKLYPGYIVVHMHINDNTWFAVRETSGVGDFTGAGGKPTPMLAHEVARIIQTEEEETDEAPKLDIKFAAGDKVKVKEGNFESFEGEVNTIDEASGRVTVMINIFGRSTPVELEYWQIEAV